MARRDDVDDDRTDSDGGRHWLGMLVPAGTFVAGLALGGVLVYANSGGDASDQPEAVPSPTPSDTTGAGDTVVTLPAECEEASQGISEGYGLLRQAVDQVRDFQAGDLVETLDELQTVDEETRPLVTACSAVDVDSSPTATPSPTEAETDAESDTESDTEPESSPAATP